MGTRKRGALRCARPSLAGATALLLLAMAAAPGAAQEWQVGVRTGLSASRMSFEDRTADELALATPGLHVGVLAVLHVMDLLVLRGEVLYSEKGFDSNVDEQLELAYLEVPLLVGLHWSVRLSPRLFVGPVVSFEVRCRSERVLGVGELDCNDALATVQRQKVDVGLLLGGGLGTPLGPGELSLELLASQGLRDINREVRPAGHVRNQALLLSIAYLFRLGAPT